MNRIGPMVILSVFFVMMLVLGLSLNMALHRPAFGAEEGEDGYDAEEVARLRKSYWSREVEKHRVRNGEGEALSDQ